MTTQRDRDIARFRLLTKMTSDPSELMADGAEYGRRDAGIRLKDLVERLRSGMDGWEYDCLIGFCTQLERNE